MGREFETAGGGSTLQGNQCGATSAAVGVFIVEEDLFPYAQAIGNIE